MRYVAWIGSMRGSRPGGLAALVAVGVATTVAIRPTAAQLISPGKLSAPHADLEGMRRCTNCHQLRERGVSNPKCLDCHTPLAERIAAKRGYHATVADQSCANCHKEHFGRDLDIVRLDTTAFDHQATGFGVEGAHTAVSCRQCHMPALIADAKVRQFKENHAALDRTFLGLGRTCEGCHAQDDPHDGQFAGRTCTDCHTQGAWTEMRFDHIGTRYPLTGAHRSTACESCHVTTRSRDRTIVKYRPLPFGWCTACHTDQHDGTMGTSCESCHSTAAWDRINRSTFEGRFDHASTDFDLAGAHANVSCRDCHVAPARRTADLHMTLISGTATRSYPIPVATTCANCHVDRHDGAFVDVPGGSTCTNCHGRNVWYPASYDAARHNQESAFPLTGGHLATPCRTCHTREDGTAHFAFAETGCVSCHAADDPHRAQFPDRACDACHETTSFAVRAFDHTETTFPLDGAHESVPCATCHATDTTPDGITFVRYRPIGTACQDCHGGGR